MPKSNKLLVARASEGRSQLSLSIRTFQHTSQPHPVLSQPVRTRDLNSIFLAAHQSFKLVRSVTRSMMSQQFVLLLAFPTRRDLRKSITLIKVTTIFLITLLPVFLGNASFAYDFGDTGCRAEFANNATNEPVFITNTTFGSTCYIGLAVSGGSDTTLNTSQFCNVTVTP